VCKKWNELSSSDQIWKIRWEQESYLLKKDFNSYKERFAYYYSRIKYIKTRNSDGNTRKVLFLGCGESGKATLFKAIKYATGNINLREMKMYRPIIHQNLQSIFFSLRDISKYLNIPLQHETEVN